MEKDTLKHKGKVLVYITDGQSNSPRYQKLSDVFNHPMFSIQKSDAPRSDRMKESSKYYTEYNQLSYALENSKRVDASSYTIVIKANTVTNADSSTVAAIIEALLSIGNFDIAYLCKWLDRCDLYTEKFPVAGKMTIISSSQHAQGAQALLFSPQGRDRLLKDKSVWEYKGTPLSNYLTTLCSSGKFKANVVSPNLFDFDVSTAVDNSDYIKLAECKPYEGANREGATATRDLLSPSGNNWMMWGLIALVIIAFIYMMSRGKRCAV